jgi:hypothetical protein
MKMEWHGKVVDLKVIHHREMDIIVGFLRLVGI